MISHFLTLFSGQINRAAVLKTRRHHLLLMRMYTMSVSNDKFSSIYIIGLLDDNIELSKAQILLLLVTNIRSNCSLAVHFDIK